ncbi:uncharacterized protein LOC110096332 [Dendrobium catenatum]|uniref:DNA-3-methyladenine glycosylase I n=1 Tax=Dendrobium catenatum TaxID=906689 RepID=A0A2I0WEQ5_9ASPA|nr:uncharacterized protein LOC110096332 [Dendrobium catenatum]PKU74138.1 DNA-3-methyladenine glycosylase I [Dendrobium catenatum]
MCNSKIDGRPVLQPAINSFSAALDPPKSMKKPSSPPAMAVLKRGNDTDGLNSSGEKPPTPRSAAAKPPIVVRKKSKKVFAGGLPGLEPAALTAAATTAGSIAAAQREQASLIQQQRKLRIAHYGKMEAKLQNKSVAVHSGNNGGVNQEEKRCTFITSNSDPFYVAYHDEEWGVPVHDDKILFELLVLCGFQVGLDWTTILKRRKEYSEAFAGFEAEVVAKFTERQMSSICSEYGIEQGRVRAVVDNANRILQITKDFSSLDKYFWSFVNYRPLNPNYKTCRKIPAKTSKSESISKDLVRRGFRSVGPTVVHSFMQAAGLTNDHLLSCPRHHHLLSLH